MYRPVFPFSPILSFNLGSLEFDSSIAQSRLLNVLGIAFFLLSATSFHAAFAADEISKINSLTVPVFYATNRQREGDRVTPLYSKKRRYAAGLEYGECNVSVPLEELDFDAKRDFALGWKGRPEKLKRSMATRVKSQSQSPAEFFDALKTRAKSSERIVLFVHGYRSTFDGALEIGGELEKVFHSPVVVFSWPSSEELLGYTKDECNIEWSLPHFKKLLAQLENEIGAEKLTIVAHSMGNRLVMWSLRDRCENARCHNETLKKFPDVVLTSPDVDTGTFKGYAADVSANTEELWVLTSSNDNALRGSSVVHERRRLGMPGPDGVDADWRQPPIVPNMKTIEFTILDKGLIGHTIQYKLIGDLTQRGTVGSAFTLAPEEKDSYRWFRLERRK